MGRLGYLSHLNAIGSGLGAARGVLGYTEIVFQWRIRRYIKWYIKRLKGKRNP
jgi:hypothetical protein